MTDIAEFLLARIAEDQALAEAVGPSPVVHATEPAVIDFLQAWHADRVLDECEATRRIVEWCAEEAEETTSGAATSRRVLRLLALPYDDHPDYREEWRA